MTTACSEDDVVQNLEDANSNHALDGPSVA